MIGIRERRKLVNSRARVGERAKIVHAKLRGRSVKLRGTSHVTYDRRSRTQRHKVGDSSRWCVFESACIPMSWLILPGYFLCEEPRNEYQSHMSMSSRERASNWFSCRVSITCVIVWYYFRVSLSL